MSLPRVRTVPTASGATAVQVLWRYEADRLVLDHVGSARTDEELALLIVRAKRLIQGDQLAFDLGLDSLPRSAVSVSAPVSGRSVGVGSGTGSWCDPLPVVGERAGYLLDAIRGVYTYLGLDTATGDDPVFYDLVAARLIQPGSKCDSIETLAEVGLHSASYSTIQRRLPVYATRAFQDPISRALARHAGIGAGVLVLYDVTTLYFETDQQDERRKPGYSKERRLEPQITVGMLTDATGLPLSVAAFEGNRAETRTMLPMIHRLMRAYDLDDVTIVADAGMFSASNKREIINAGLGYILGVKTSDIPVVIQHWRDTHPGQDYPDGHIWASDNLTDRANTGVPYSVTYYQYSHDRARRTLKGVAEQVTKAERAVAGLIPVKRNRYVNLKDPDKRVNYALADKHRALAGIKGYETNRVDLSAEQVIHSYRQLFRIEKSFRMAKSDLKARPIYHRKKDSIDAHLTIVMCATACGHVLEETTGISVKRLVRTLKRYRTFTINADGQHIHAHIPLPTDIHNLIQRIPKPD